MSSAEGGRRRTSRLLGEFMLVVVGVLAALAVDEWRGSLADRERGRQYLSRLAGDLDRTYAAITTVDARYDDIVRNGRATLAVLRGEADFPHDTTSFVLSAYIPTRSFEPQVSRATYDDLVSTGNLDLIRPHALRDSIMGYYENVEFTLFPTDFDLDRAEYRMRVRSLMPLDLQLQLQACGFDETAPCVAEPRSASRSAQELLAEPGLERALTLSMQSSSIRTFDLVLETTARLREEIRAALTND